MLAVFTALHHARLPFASFCQGCRALDVAVSFWPQHADLAETNPSQLEVTRPCGVLYLRPMMKMGVVVPLVGRAE